MKKRIGFVLLFAVCVLFLFASCSKGETESQTKDTLPGETQGEEELQPAAFSDFLPETNLGGRVFCILGTGEAYGAGYYVPDDVASEAETGEPVNDATYRRNSELETEYNFTLKLILSNSIPGDINKTVKAGTYEYDAVMHWMGELSGSMLSGNLYDLNSLKHVDFQKPWWNKNAAKNLQFFGGLYLMGGDLVRYSYTGTLATYFSKSLAMDLGMPDFYDIVRGGDWTLDKMFEFAKLAKKDANGDGKWDYNDTFGLMLHQKCIISLYYATGEKLMETTADGSIQLRVNNAKTLAFIDKMLEYIWEEGTYQQTEKHKASPGAPHVYADTRNMLCSGQILFLVNAVNDAMLDEMRSHMGNFGILPLPKFDRAQQNHYSSITGSDLMLAVPAAVENPDEIGFMLEAVCARSSVTTKKAVYDVTLINKGIRDEDSGEMLDIIFDNIIFDVGYILNPSNIINLISDSMGSGKNNFASQYEKNESKYIKKLEDIENSLK